MTELEHVICLSLTIYVGKSFDFIIALECVFGVVHAADLDRNLCLRED